MIYDLSEKRHFKWHWVRDVIGILIVKRMVKASNFNCTLVNLKN